MSKKSAKFQNKSILIRDYSNNIKQKIMWHSIVSAEDWGEGKSVNAHISNRMLERAVLAR